MVRFPRQDLRHGSYSLQLEDAARTQFDTLFAAIEARPAPRATTQAVRSERCHSDPLLISLQRFKVGKRMAEQRWLSVPLAAFEKSSASEPQRALQQAMHALAERAAPMP